VGAGLAGIAIVALIIGRIQGSRRQMAAQEFRLAHRAFQAGRFAEAATAFAGVVAGYSRTPFGNLAALYLGHARAREGDASGAAAAYLEFLAAGSTAPYLRQEALVGLGRAREGGQDRAGALEAYSEAAALSGPYQNDALLAAARLKEASDDLAGARSLYGVLLRKTADQELRAFLLTKMSPGEEAAEESPPEPGGPGADVR
jgi:hypothetical protein